MWVLGEVGTNIKDNFSDGNEVYIFVSAQRRNANYN